MHIVFVSREYPPSLRSGGIASYIKEMAGALVRHGHQVTIICASDDTTKSSDSHENGIHIIRLSGGDFVIPAIEKTSLLRKLRSLTRFHSYRKKIRNTILSIPNIDVIEVGEFGAEAYYLRDIGIPVTIRLHTPTLLDRQSSKLRKFDLKKFPEFIIGQYELKTLASFNHITSCSIALKDWALKHIPSLKSDISVIYNPIDLSIWNCNYETNYKENRILYAGTVSPGKGIKDLIDACAILVNNGVDINLEIAGKLGNYALSLKKLCKDYGYTWCHFLGNLTREQLMEEYRNAKIACFPSWWENMPLVCLEAMSIGNIVIGSNNGGMAEIITDSTDGYLITPHNPDCLAKVIAKALKMTKSDVTIMRNNARKKIRDYFSTDVIISQFINYYKSIANHED